MAGARVRNSNNMSLAVGVETVVRPNLLNQVRAGYLYTRAAFGQGGPDGYMTSPQINYGYGGYDDFWEMPNSRKQPILSVSDTMTWVKRSHTMTFGFNAYREVNQYWDPPEGFTIMSLGMHTNDPARDALTKQALQAAAGPGAPLPTDTEWANAMQLYTMLSGRINNFSGRHAYLPSTGAYAEGSTPNSSGVAFSTLDELLVSWGLFVQDSWRLKPNFTVNAGLRWDFVSPNIDRTGKYHSMTPQDLYGPTGVGQLFNPGAASLTGTMDPVYTARAAAYGHWNVTPQPAVGIAWTPRSNGSFFERLLGGDKSVVRSSYSFRRFTMPQQFVWDMGSSFGIGFYQNFSSSPSTSGVKGTFMPGSMTLGGPGWLPQSCANTPTAPACYVYSPQQYDKVIHRSESTFVGGAAAAINSDIRQPYTQSWSVGVQRQLGNFAAVEVRYNGNITRNQWLAMDINEVNIFENGFLNEFTNAQSNLKINQAAGVSSFANRGLPGQVNLPIMTATGLSFTNSTFINQLINGQAGSFSNTLATNRDYYCRMVGTSFGPCGTSYGAGAGYPINFWLANPFAIGSWTGASYMSDTGYSNYNSLQVEYRQRPWHGVSGSANYTLSKTMGVATAGDWTGSVQPVHGPRPHVQLRASGYRPAARRPRERHLRAALRQGQEVARGQQRARQDRRRLDGLHDHHVPERHAVPDFRQQQHVQQQARRRPDPEWDHPAGHPGQGGPVLQRRGAAVLPAPGLGHPGQDGWHPRLPQRGGSLGPGLLPPRAVPDLL